MGRINMTYLKNHPQHALPLTALCGSHGRTAPAVQLRHDMPDGSRHIDLMIGPPAILHQPPDPDDRCLLTFRLPVPLWEIGQNAPIEITRLPDHRFFYFTHEGEVPGVPGVRGDLGHVERLALGAIEPMVGLCSDHDMTADSVWTLHADSGVTRETVRFRLERVRDRQWLLRTGV